jgi:hypothetical protein
MINNKNNTHISICLIGSLHNVINGNIFIQDIMIIVESLVNVSAVFINKKEMIASINAIINPTLGEYTVIRAIYNKYQAKTQ